MSEMKLKIHSDIISKLKHVLEQNYNFHFRFGNKFRNGFSPFLNSWDYKCIKDFMEVKYSPIHTKVGKRYYTQICDLGFIQDRQVILTQIAEEKGEDYTIDTFKTEKYDIKLIKNNDEYQVEIKLTDKPENITELFSPVKFLYGIIKSRISPIIDNKDKIIEDYNSLFGKIQETPWIVPQGINFIDKIQIKTIQDYVVMPICKGIKYILYLSSTGAYMISKRQIFIVDVDIVPVQLHGSVVTGYWYNKKFTTIDILRFGLKDIRGHSLLKRFKHLVLVSELFPFCVMIQFIIKDIYKNTKILLKKYDGVIFYPIKANYMNDKVFIYQPVEKVGINFKVEKYVSNGFHTFGLKCGNNNDFFIGSTEYPLKYLIPLSKEDQDFIGPLDNNTVFEFRWESDGLMPYVRVPKNSTSTRTFSKKAWSYINNTSKKVFS